MAVRSASVLAGAQGFDEFGRPKLPGWESQTGPGGLMQSQFQVAPELQKRLDTIKMDPRGLESFRQEALRKGPSSWAALQNKSLGLQEQTARQQAAAQAAQGMAQGRAGLAMRGGLSGGASERMARAGGLGMLQAQQDIGRQGMQNRLSVATEDEKQRMAALGQLPGMEVQALQPEIQKTQMWGQGQQFDLANALKEAQNKRDYEQKMYEEKNKIYMGDQMAQAEREKNKGGGCCFIFLEARYGNGTMDGVVRRYRDEHVNARNMRGYHKLSEVLVPAMRRSGLAKFLVRTFMTDPMVAYGKYYYGKNRYGAVFAPIAKFWLKTFEYLGQDHEYLRENGEYI